MNAWLLEGLGGLSKMHLGVAPDPVAGLNEVVLRMHFAALNPADRYLAEGQYPARPTFPHILGRDGFGTIVDVGNGVTNWKVGDRAVLLRGEMGVNRPGTLAEKVAVPVESLASAPPNWTEEQSAGAALVYLTAYQALTQWNDLPSDANVLITGASGGVGVASIHLATAMGYKVIAMSRGDSKREALMKLGAFSVLDPADTQWRKRCRDLLAGGRIDLAIDNIGGTLFSELLDTLGFNAKVSLVGRLAGPVPQFNTASLFSRRISMRGVFVSTYQADEAQHAWSNVVALMGKTSATPVVDRIFPFDRLPEAFARLEEGPLGKVLIRVH